MIETESGSQTYVLFEAYDRPPVNVIIPEDDEQLALTVNGKKHNIRRNDFLKSAETAGIPLDAAMEMIQKIISMQDEYLSACKASYLPNDLKERFKALIDEQTDALK